MTERYDSSVGLAVRVYIEDTDAGGIVQRLSIHYGAPARLDDELRVTAEPVAFGRVWMDFRQRVVRRSDDKVLASADVRVACIALDSGRPRRLPVNMLELLESSLKTNSQVE